MRVTVPLPLPNKANTYQVHFAPWFWKAIQDIVSGIRGKGFKGKLYWAAPTKEVTEVERAIGFIAKQALPDEHDGPIILDVWISDKLDWDAVKAISDGVEKSGRIQNDKQIKIGHVYKVPEPNKAFMFDLTPITEEEWQARLQESLKSPSK